MRIRTKQLQEMVLRILLHSIVIDALLRKRRKKKDGVAHY